MKHFRSASATVVALGMMWPVPSADFSAMSAGPAHGAEPSVAASACPEGAVLSKSTMNERYSYEIGYDSANPPIQYGSMPVSNPVAHLQARLESGETTLKHVDGRGYLDAVLADLGIEPTSQILVYSTSSLQQSRIKAATPRAIYFNDDTYVAWIPGTEILEIATMDCQKGAVFYTLDNTGADGRKMTRQMNACLACHDSIGLAGGGAPLFLASSIATTTDGRVLDPSIYNIINDATPFEKRWGGWYVTGKTGRQTHMGNLQVKSQAELDQADKSAVANIDSAGKFFDASPYLSDKSDIVALMVFEHQTSVQNALTATNFRVRSILSRQLSEAEMDTAWADLTPDVQTRIIRQIEPAVDALLLAKSVQLTDKISGNSGFDTAFQAKGLRDPAGRSLRDLDLETRLFRYPVSYVIYSEAFDGLPRAAREYIYRRIAEVLEGKDANPKFSGQAEDQRKAALDILMATKPDFARAIAG